MVVSTFARLALNSLLNSIAVVLVRVSSLVLILTDNPRAFNSSSRGLFYGIKALKYHRHAFLQSALWTGFSAAFSLKRTLRLLFKAPKRGSGGTYSTLLPSLQRDPAHVPQPPQIDPPLPLTIPFNRQGERRLGISCSQITVQFFPSLQLPGCSLWQAKLRSHHHFLAGILAGWCNKCLCFFCFFVLITLLSWTVWSENQFSSSNHDSFCPSGDSTVWYFFHYKISRTVEVITFPCSFSQNGI